MSVLLREAIGGSIRRARTERNRTLRDVSHSARVSLGYLSEIERGRKEPSSELLAAICEALSLPLPDLLDEVAESMRPRALRPRRTVTVLDPALRTAVEEALEGAGDDAADTSSVDTSSVEGDSDETLPVGGAGDADTPADGADASLDAGLGLVEEVPGDGAEELDESDGQGESDAGDTEDDDDRPGDEPLVAPALLLGRARLVTPLDGSLTSGLATVRVAA